jgi:hypothetical protein
MFIGRKSSRQLFIIPADSTFEKNPFGKWQLLLLLFEHHGPLPGRGFYYTITCPAMNAYSKVETLEKVSSVDDERREVTGVLHVFNSFLP